MSKEPELGYKQKIWLRIHGDRDIFDLEYFNRKWGINMFSPLKKRKLKFYPLPLEDNLKIVIYSKRLNSANQERFRESVVDIST